MNMVGQQASMQALYTVLKGMGVEIDKVQPGSSFQMPVGGGKTTSARMWTEPEFAAFERDYRLIASEYTRFTINERQEHIISDVYEYAKYLVAAFGMVAADQIKPNSGQFEGMAATGGYGMRTIRPEDVLPAAQTRSFDYTLAAVGKDVWTQGVWHFAAIGAALGLPLYLRDFLLVVVLGLLDVGGNPGFGEFQFTNIEGVQYPVQNALQAFTVGDLGLHRFASPVALLPAKRYRLEGKTLQTNAQGALIPIGVTFEIYDLLIDQAPTQPTQVRP